ncbi:MAG: hypothetical protein J6D03_04740 [Clostridia bacterium]|nr:hypothetical protein [Clostridia bacterium]
MWKWEKVQELLWEIANYKTLQVWVKTQMSAFCHPKLKVADRFLIDN